MKHVRVIALFSLIIALSLVWGRPESTVEIASWRGDSAGALTLSFDDGYLDTYENVIPILEEQGINVSFNIITGRVGRVYGRLGLAGWDRWRLASQSGHEIASHSHTHIHADEAPPQRLTEELVTSRELITENVGAEAVSFVYPGGAYSPDSSEVVSKHFISARTSDAGFNVPSPKDMHLLKSMTAASYSSHELDSWAKEAQERGAWLIENYHLVSKSNPKEYSFYVSTDDFNSHIKNISKMDLWIAPQGEVAAYILERDTAKTRLKKEDGDHFSLYVHTPLEGRIFKVPLTLKITLPENWDSPTAFKSGREIPSKKIGNLLIIDAVPGPEKIVISR